MMDEFAEFLGKTHRPFSIYALSFSAAYAIINISHRVVGFGEAAAFVGVVLTGLGALYWGRAWENSKVAK